MPSDRRRRRQGSASASSAAVAGPSTASSSSSSSSFDAATVALPTTPQAQTSSHLALVPVPPPLAPKPGWTHRPRSPYTPCPSPHRRRQELSRRRAHSEIDLTRYILREPPPEPWVKPWVYTTLNDVHPTFYPELYRHLRVEEWTEEQQEANREVARLWLMAYRRGWRVSPVKGDLCPVRFMYSCDSVKMSGFEEKRLVAMGGEAAAPRKDPKGKGKEVVAFGEADGEVEEGMEGVEGEREPENKKVQKRWKFDTTKLLMGGPAMEREEIGEVTGGEDGMRVRTCLPFVTIHNFSDLEAILELPQLPYSGDSEDDIDIDLDCESKNECEGEMDDVNEKEDDPTTNIELYSITRLPSPTVSTNILSLPDNSLSAKYFDKLTEGKQPDRSGTYWVTPTLASSSDSKYRKGEWALPGRAKTSVVYEGYCSYDLTKQGTVPVNEVLEWTWKNGFDDAVRFEEIGEGKALQERISYYPEDDGEEEGGLTEHGDGDVSMRDDSLRPAHELVGVSDDPNGCLIS